MNLDLPRLAELPGMGPRNLLFLIRSSDISYLCESLETTALICQLESYSVLFQERN